MTFCRFTGELEGGGWRGGSARTRASCGREHLEVPRLRLRLRGVVLTSRVQEPRRAILLLRHVPHLQERRVQRVEFALELLDEDVGALVEPRELHLRGVDHRLQAVLDDLHCLHDLAHRRLGQAALSIEHPGHLVVHLQGLVLESVDAFGVVVGRIHELTPRGTIQLVLTTQVSHQAAQGLYLHGASKVFLLDNLRDFGALRGR